MTQKRTRRKKNPRLFKGEKVSFKVTKLERQKLETLRRRTKLSFGRLIVKKLLPTKKSKPKRRKSANAKR